VPPKKRRTLFCRPVKKAVGSILSGRRRVIRPQTDLFEQKITQAAPDLPAAAALSISFQIVLGGFCNW